jgi:hypothetical protein
MMLTIPLTDDERAAVDEGADAVKRLLARLAVTPTPAGPTPREIQPPPHPLLSINPICWSSTISVSNPSGRPAPRISTMSSTNGIERASILL